METFKKKAVQQDIQITFPLNKWLESFKLVDLGTFFR